jgi:hypothetical protein
MAGMAEGVAADVFSLLTLLALLQMRLCRLHAPGDFAYF